MIYLFNERNIDAISHANCTVDIADVIDWYPAAQFYAHLT